MNFRVPQKVRIFVTSFTGIGISRKILLDTPNAIKVSAELRHFKEDNM
jgi:hypothetical protein